MKGKSQSLSSGDLSTIKSLTQISLKSQSTLSLSTLKPHQCQWKTLTGELGAFPALPTPNGMNLCPDPIVLLITLRATHQCPLTNTSIIANFVSFLLLADFLLSLSTFLVSSSLNCPRYLSSSLWLTFPSHQWAQPLSCSTSPPSLLHYFEFPDFF